ncbi:MAG: hypothetical protein ACTSU5_01275 [Promethearchaeota archaeon]
MVVDVDFDPAFLASLLDLRSLVSDFVPRRAWRLVAGGPVLLVVRLATNQLKLARSIGVNTTRAGLAILPLDATGEVDAALRTCRVLLEPAVPPPPGVTTAPDKAPPLPGPRAVDLSGDLPRLLLSVHAALAPVSGLRYRIATHGPVALSLRGTPLTTRVAAGLGIRPGTAAGRWLHLEVRGPGGLARGRSLVLALFSALASA